MKYVITLFLISGIALAGVRFGGRIGYYNGNDPRTNLDEGCLVYGGQVVFSFVDMIQLEFSAGYASSESEITMEQYLLSYLEDNVPDFVPDSLVGYLEEQGWNPSDIEGDLLGEYTATFYDLELGGTVKVMLPFIPLPVLKPYIGLGGGAHIIFSDADVLMQVASEETGGLIEMDPYDHVHPGIHGVVGLQFKPHLVPLSVFAEYKYAKPFGSDENEAEGIGMFYGGINIGF